MGRSAIGGPRDRESSRGGSLDPRGHRGKCGAAFMPSQTRGASPWSRKAVDPLAITERDHILEVVASARGGKRKALSLAIDERVLDSSVAVICSYGPDGLNLSEVAREAGVTTGAVYGRYESREELLIDVWVKRAGPQIRALLDFAARASAGDAHAVADATKMLAARDRRLSAGFALMVMSSRVDELGEVVLQEVRGWFSDTPGWCGALIPIAFALGAVGFDSALGAPRRDWGTPLAWVIEAGAPAPRRRRATAAPREDALADLIQASTGDPVRDALLVSMASIVARGGVARATTARVARAAGYPQSAVFALWPTRADLIAEWAPTVAQGLMRSAAPAGRAAMQGDAAGAARGLAEIVGPTYRQARRMRLELVLTAMTDRVVDEALAASHDSSIAYISQQEPGLRVLAEAIRSVVMGLQLLEETVGGVADVDFTRAIAPLLTVARSK